MHRKGNIHLERKYTLPAIQKHFNCQSQIKHIYARKGKQARRFESHARNADLQEANILRLSGKKVKTKTKAKPSCQSPQISQGKCIKQHAFSSKGCMLDAVFAFDTRLCLLNVLVTCLSKYYFKIIYLITKQVRVVFPMLR